MTGVNVSAPEGKPEGAPTQHDRRRTAGNAAVAALILGALGVVFGDIGTSPLYSMSSIFAVRGSGRTWRAWTG